MPLYSEEVQDIMGQIPGRILRVGMMIIFGIMLLLLLGSYFFRYPEIVSCPIVLTTINPPLELYAKSEGKIERLCVKEHQAVHAGQLVAVIKNTADYADAARLEQTLKRLNGVIAWDSVVRMELPDISLALGELQSNYIRFCKLWSNLHHYLRQNYLPLKINLLDRQIRKRQEAFRVLCSQQDLLLHDFQLAEKQYHRDSVFFHKYKDAVSMVDYEKQTQNYLQKKSSYMSFCSSVKSMEDELLKLDENRIDLEIQYEKELNVFRLDLDEAYGLLVEAYNQWKEKYIIESLMDGIITFTGYWSENQVVKSGERLATVVPAGKMQIVGRAVVGMAGIGKVEKGQQVNIKLNGFPFMEYGILRGIVSNISLVPEKEKGYIAEILLTGGMKSSYREQLNFIQEMEGIAEIITKKERLLSRLVNPLKSKIKE